MTNLRAAILHAPGPANSFSIEDVPIPHVGDDDVLVRVQACGVSYRDVVERNGTYKRDVVFPLIMGIEIAGTVVRTGPLVRDLKPGDRVCSKAFSSCGDCRYCRSGRETTCLSRRPVRGGYAEFSVMPQDAFVVFPEAIPFEMAAILGPGAGVALNAVRDTANVKVGETVLVTGATGGVGYAAVQLAALAGARVIAVTRDGSRAAGLIEAGASDVVEIKSDHPFSFSVRELTNGVGADVVIDTVGSRVFGDAFDSLALHGRYAVVGQLFGEKVEINLARLFFKRAALLGVGSVSRVQLEDVISLASRGLIKPRIATTKALDDVGEAHRLVEEGTLFGRVILKP